MTTSMISSRPVASAAIAIAVVGAAAILGAWFFQYGLGLKPCPLCLEQRYAYYFAIPLALMVALGDHFGASRKVLTAALVAIALGMLWNAGLGVYHSGIEWKWWAGPQECSGALDSLGVPGGLLNQLQSISVVRCDEAAWRFLGLVARGLQRARLARARRHRRLGRGDGMARAGEMGVTRAAIRRRRFATRQRYTNHLAFRHSPEMGQDRRRGAGWAARTPWCDVKGMRSRPRRLSRGDSRGTASGCFREGALFPPC